MQPMSIYLHFTERDRLGAEFKEFERRLKFETWLVPFEIV